MSYDTIRYELDDHVAVLTYDRPEQRNAVSRRMNAELHEAWRRFRDDEDAFVLVITGEGEAFCAGWDLTDAAETSLDDWDEFRTHVYNSPGGLRLHAPDRCLQAGDCRRQRLGRGGGARECPARGYPDRRGERGLRRPRAPLEHRRRRRDDGPPPARRRLREGDGDDRHRSPSGRAGGPSNRARERGRPGGAGARPGARARAWGGRPPPGSDPLRQGNDGPQRRPHLRGAATHGDGDDPLDVHAPGLARDRRPGFQGGHGSGVAKPRPVGVAVAPRRIPVG